MTKIGHDKNRGDNKLLLSLSSNSKGFEDFKMYLAL